MFVAANRNMCHQYLVRRLVRVISTSGGSGSRTVGEEQRVTVEFHEDGIARVALNRPEKLNALDLPMFEAIFQAAKELESNRSVRAVILSGKGRAFSTGLDVKSAMSSGNVNPTLESFLERPEGAVANLVQDVAYRWRQLPVPVIATLQGMCFGAGLQIALGCDIRLATPDCKLSIMESKWGLIPDMSISVTLRELVRIDVAKELTMTGRVVTGSEAAQLGLVTRVVEDPHAEALALAQEVAQRSPDSVALSKELYQRTWLNENEAECLLLETQLQRRLLKSWNQLAASGRTLGVPVPYSRRSKTTDNRDDKSS